MYLLQGCTYKIWSRRIYYCTNWIIVHKCFASRGMEIYIKFRRIKLHLPSIAIWQLNNRSIVKYLSDFWKPQVRQQKKGIQNKYPKYYNAVISMVGYLFKNQIQCCLPHSEDCRITGET